MDWTTMLSAAIGGCIGGGAYYGLKAIFRFIIREEDKHRGP